MTQVTVGHSTGGGDDHRPHQEERLHSSSGGDCQIFDRGFGLFFHSGDFSDVMVVVKETGTVYHLHKIILAYSSKYFSKYFDNLEKSRHVNNDTNGKNTIKQNKNENNDNNTGSNNKSDNTKDKANINSINTNTSGLLPLLSNISLNKNTHPVATSPLSLLSPRSTFSTSSNGAKTPTSDSDEDDENDNNNNNNNNGNSIKFQSTASLAELVREMNNQEKDRIELGGPFTQYFQHVVKYMYEGSVEFTAENAIPLLAMADFYQIKELRHAASDYLLSSITRENALMMLQKATHFNAEEVANKCITVICKNFNQIASLSLTNPPPASHSSTHQISHHIPTNSTISLNSLPLAIVIRIVKQNNLAVASEYVVYKTVCSYIDANNATLSPQDITSLFETVRFPWLNYQQLTETEENPLVPRHLLTEALFIRLKQHEAPIHKDPKKPETEELYHNIRLTPRAAYAISLEYHSDFDEHGLFYYIGTNAGREEWSNPGMRGRVRVSCSSQEKGNIVDLVGRTSTECWSMDVPSSWVMINLGSSRSLVPNYYTLRHGGNSKADGLRNWTLQGSSDSTNWTVLIRHSNDSSLNGNFAVCSWPIPNCTQAYRYFRVLQNGRNSSNHNFLSLSGIEFYGDLYETRKDEAGTFV